MDLRDLSMTGDVWRVSIPLAASMVKPIVVPRSNRLGPRNINNQATTVRRDGITILGFGFNFVSTGAATLTLRSADSAFIEGTTTTYPIYAFDAGAAGTWQQTFDHCVIPLSPAKYNPTPSDGATLELATSSGVSSGGMFMAWGIHGQLDIGGRYSYTGSPALYDTDF